MRLKASDMFRRDLTPAEYAGVLAGEPRDATVVGVMLGRFYHAELFRGGKSIGVGTSQTAAVSAIIAALEDKSQEVTDTP